MPAGRLAASLLAVALLFVTAVAATAARARDGDLDRAFGGDGRVITRWPDSASLRDLAVEPSGAIVAVGALNEEERFPGPTHVVLAKYRPDGRLDRNFGAGGRVDTNFPGTDEEPLALVRRPDGRLVVVGFSTTSSDEDLQQRTILVLGYRANGRLDSRFGVGGVTRSDLPDCESEAALAAVIDHSGRIVVGAQCTNGFVRRLAILRYTAQGALDTAAPPVAHGFEGLSVALQDLAIQRDGRIVAVSVVNVAETDEPVGSMLLRFRSDGSLDNAFGSGGRIDVRGVSGFLPLVSVLVQPDGKIVAAGTALDDRTGGSRFALLRTTRDGQRDSTFGRNALVTTKFGYGASARDVAWDAGRLVVAGDDWPKSPGPQHFAVARYAGATGALDRTFGRGGKVTRPFPDSTSENLAALGIDRRRGLVVGGEGFAARSFVFALARYRSRPPAGR